MKMPSMTIPTNREEISRVTNGVKMVLVCVQQRIRNVLSPRWMQRKRKVINALDRHSYIPTERRRTL